MTHLREVLDRLGDVGEPGEPTVLFRAATVRARHLRRRRRVIVGAVPTVLVLVVGAVWLSKRSTDTEHVVANRPSASPVLEDLASVIALPTAVVVADGHLWVTGYAPGGGPATLLDFDATSRALVGRVQLADDSPFAMAASGRSIWIRTQQAEQSTSLVKVDTATHEVVGRIPLRQDGGLAATDTGVWTIDSDRLLRFDPVSATVTATVPLQPSFGFGPVFVATGSAGTWLTNPYDNTVLRVDDSTSTATVFTTLSDRAGPIVAMTDAVWVSTGTQLVGLDPNNPNSRTAIDLQSRILDVAVDGPDLWAVTDAGLYYVDTAQRSARAVALPAPSTGPSLVAVDPHTRSVWVTTNQPPAAVQVA